MVQVVKLGEWDDDVRQNEDWIAFIDRVKETGTKGIVFGETEEGEMFIGCNHTNAKDLIYIYHMLQGMINSLITGDLESNE